MKRSFAVWLLATGYWLLSFASAAHAQEGVSEEDARPAFSLSTSEVFTTRDAPNFYLTFRRIEHLDFRVYKVKDPFAFFAGLDNPHQVGTDEARVEQERTWLERFADWKRGQTQSVHRFMRSQASHEYRSTRRAVSDQAEVAQRVVLNKTTFAQVPLLNADQVVTTWREISPTTSTPKCGAPVDLKQPGIYVIEAVSELLRLHHRHRLTSASSPRPRPARWCSSPPIDSPASRRPMRHPGAVFEEDHRRRPHQRRRLVRSDAA